MYGYMPKDVKNLVDEVVDKLERNPKVAELYDLWYRQKCAIIATYTSNYASLLLALFLVTKLLGGKSLNRIKGRTVGHGQHGSLDGQPVERFVRTTRWFHMNHRSGARSRNFVRPTQASSLAPSSTVAMGRRLLHGSMPVILML